MSKEERKDGEPVVGRTAMHKDIVDKGAVSAKMPALVSVREKIIRRKSYSDGTHPAEKVMKALSGYVPARRHYGSVYWVDGELIAVTESRSLRRTLKGGNGIVRPARAIGGGRMMAFKQINIGQLESSESALELLEDVCAALNIEHKLFARQRRGRKKGRVKVTLMTPWDDGGNLYQFISRYSTRDYLRHYTPEKRLTLCYSMLVQVLMLHRARLIHRDLKLENVMLNNRGRVQVVDYGFAVRAKKGVVTAEKVAGTPSYYSESRLNDAMHKRPTALSIGVDYRALHYMIAELFPDVFQIRDTYAAVYRDKEGVRRVRSHLSKDKFNALKRRECLGYTTHMMTVRVREGVRREGIKGDVISLVALLNRADQGETHAAQAASADVVQAELCRLPGVVQQVAAELRDDLKARLAAFHTDELLREDKRVMFQYEEIEKALLALNDETMTFEQVAALRIKHYEENQKLIMFKAACRQYIDCVDGVKVGTLSETQKEQFENANVHLFMALCAHESLAVCRVAFNKLLQVLPIKQLYGDAWKADKGLPVSDHTTVSSRHASGGRGTVSVSSVSKGERPPVASLKVRGAKSPLAGAGAAAAAPAVPAPVSAAAPTPSPEAVSAPNASLGSHAEAARPAPVVALAPPSAPAHEAVVSPERDWPLEGDWMPEESWPPEVAPDAMAEFDAFLERTSASELTSAAAYAQCGSTVFAPLRAPASGSYKPGLMAGAGAAMPGSR